MTTVVVVEGEDIIVVLGKFENRVPKVVKVEVTAAAKLSPGLATAWTRTPVVDPSRATIYPGTWRIANDFMTDL